MNRPDPAAARKEIGELIAASLRQARALMRSLEIEREALEQQDTDALHTVVIAKNDCAEKLQALDEQRSALCDGWGFVAGPGQMDALIDWCDEDDVIHANWGELIQLAAAGNALNLTNGAIVRLRQQQFDASLSVLRGVTPGPDTYSRNGEGTGDSARRSLAEA